MPLIILIVIIIVVVLMRTVLGAQSQKTTNISARERELLILCRGDSTKAESLAN